MNNKQSFGVSCVEEVFIPEAYEAPSVFRSMLHTNFQSRAILLFYFVNFNADSTTPIVRRFPDSLWCIIPLCVCNWPADEDEA